MRPKYAVELTLHDLIMSMFAINSSPAARSVLGDVRAAFKSPAVENRSVQTRLAFRPRWVRSLRGIVFALDPGSSQQGRIIASARSTSRDHGFLAGTGFELFRISDSEVRVDGL